jgi:hypothetical protein
MKKIIPLIWLLLSFNVFAADSKEEWSPTTLSEETIKKIQSVQYDYKKCASDEMQNLINENKTSQKLTDATNEIMGKCESYLAKMKAVYLDEKVPETIADRHLKQMRIKTTRNVIQELMYREAMQSNPANKK